MTVHPEQLSEEAARRYNERRQQFDRVMEFLRDRGCHVERGWGRDADVVYHNGHRERSLADEYGKRALL